MPGEGRDLSSRQTQDVGKDRRLGNRSTPASVRKLQRALHAKAKAAPDYRFYALYDMIYREDILAYAYAQCHANKGAPGVGGQDFADVEAYEVERWLGELALALRERRPIDQTRSGSCLSPRPMASSGRWVFRPCGIGSA